MKILRIVLGLLLAAYVLLLNLRMAVDAVLIKLHVHPLFAAGAQADSLTAMPTWQVALWVVGLVPYAVGAWRLLFGGRAFPPVALGVLLQIAMSAALIAGRSHSAADLAHDQADIVITVVFAVVAGLVWLTERRPRAAVAAA